MEFKTLTVYSCFFVKLKNMETVNNNNMEPEDINEDINSVLDVDNKRPITSNDITTDASEDSGDEDTSSQNISGTDEDDLELADYNDLDADVDENDLRALNGLDQDDQQTMS
jgi:hypothetical protein